MMNPPGQARPTRKGWRKRPIERYPSPVHRFMASPACASYAPQAISCDPHEVFQRILARLTGTRDAVGRTELS